MASPLEIKLILCDAAVADPAGKLHMLGAGWSLTSTPTAPQAVAMLIKIPWDRANQKLHFALRLLDPDGKQVTPGRYEWRLELAEQTLVESFTVRSQ